MSKSKIKWKTDPESEDYDGVKEFLTLINSDADAERLLDRLRKAATIKRAAKDILRAAALPLLGDDDPHVGEDLKRIQKGRPLAPVLLVRGDMKKDRALTIADGYHRICAVFAYDESAPIPCRLADG